MKKILYIFILIFFVFITFVYAHSGRTDSNGGHYDSSTGEYHYHNDGYTNIDSALSDLLPLECPNCNAPINASNGTYCFECGYRLIDLSNYNIGFFVDGIPDKTRSEYFEEVQNLEKENEELLEQINLYKNDLSELNVNSIQELKSQLESQKINIKNYQSTLCFVGIILVFLFIKYYILKKDKEANK